MTPRAWLIDDDDAIRDALAWLLESRGIASTGFVSGADFLAALTPDHAGCVVLDIRMDGMSGLELFDRLRDAGCPLPVIFLTGHGDVPMAVGALKKGAFDFVEKPFNDNELADKVAEAMALDARRRATVSANDGVRARLATLTAREREVMDRILAGRLNKLIADELSISMRTVEVHRARLFEKMGVRTAVELARLLQGR